MAPVRQVRSAGEMDERSSDMLLTGYHKEIFRSECMPGVQTLHCFAHLGQDIGKVLPYLGRFCFE